MVYLLCLVCLVMLSLLLLERDEGMVMVDEFGVFYVEKRLDDDIKLW